MKIEPHEVRTFTFSISDAWDYVKLLMHILQFVMSYSNRGFTFSPSKKTFVSYLKISSEEPRRIYLYISSNKYISIINPFNCYIENERIGFRLNGIFITEKICSNIIAIIEAWKDKGGNRSLGVFEFLASNDDEDLDSNSFAVLEQLLLSESGYIRHDDDVKNENGQKHPKTHFDVNFSKNATFKLGTYRMFNSLDFEMLFGKKNDCKYIDDYSTRVTMRKKQRNLRQCKKNKRR